MQILTDLKARNIIKDITNLQKFKGFKKNDGVYIGFDPSAQSLHLGNYIQIAILKRFESFGFKAFAVLGGATGMIGDPSGKSEERNLLDEKVINKNKHAIKKQLQHFGLNVIDNFDFYKNMNVLEYLRDVGKLLNINYMVNKELVKNRLETGLSYTEFSYQLIQGWDFKMLYQHYDVKIQIGGSDQWGNITSGLEMIRKTLGDGNQAVGITTNLLLTSSGKKFGKSENNAIWLNPDLTSPYQMYQYLFNSDDQSCEQYLKWLTFLDLKVIHQILKHHQKNLSKRLAQETLAFEVTKDIHGLKNAQSAQKISKILFGVDESFNNLSTEEILNLSHVLLPIKIKNGLLIDQLVNSSIVSSKRLARELIAQGAIEINNQQIKSLDYEITRANTNQGFLLLKRGKKNYFLLKLI